jgi:hypothetical protein
MLYFFSLVTFVDSSQKLESGIPITTITLGGTVIVIDVKSFNGNLTRDFYLPLLENRLILMIQAES